MAILTATAVAAALTACGGARPESDDAQVRSVAHAYLAAITRHDGSKVCSLLTPAAERAVADLGRVALGRSKGAACSEVLTAISTRLWTGGAPVARVTRVTVAPTHDSAIVQMTAPSGVSTDVPLVKSASGWRVVHAALPSGGSGARASGRPTTIPVAPPPAIAHAGGQTLTAFELGRAVAAQTGCLACHRIGEAGNAGPGPDLTGIGARLPSKAIERTIIKPTAPMPSFRRLPASKLRALVTFLSLLRG